MGTVVNRDGLEDLRQQNREAAVDRQQMLKANRELIEQWRPIPGHLRDVAESLRELNTELKRRYEGCPVPMPSPAPTPTWPRIPAYPEGTP